MPRPAELVLAEISDPGVAFSFWRILTDLRLWCDAEPAGRPHVFRDQTRFPLTLPPGLEQVAAPLGRLWRREPESASVLASLLQSIWEWAERNRSPELALQCAELAAALDPDSSARSATAGRLCRRCDERVRGTMWFRRAVRLARLSGERNAEIEFAIAHLGWGNLESDLGRFSDAAEHARKGFRAALRAGRRSLAASGYHDLMAIAIHTERFVEAEAYAQNAVAFYKPDHPRLPALVHDVAYLWARLGYFSSATPLYEAVLPLITLDAERVVVLANLARAAGACRDRLRYERAFRAVEALRAAGGRIPASAFYHLAEGCRSFEEWERAELCCGLALRLALDRGNELIVRQAEGLLGEIAVRASGDRDVIPPEGGAVDSMRETLSRKLRRHHAPAAGSAAVPPEKYPIER